MSKSKAQRPPVPPQPAPQPRRWLLPALGLGGALLAVIVGLAIWLPSRSQPAAAPAPTATSAPIGPGDSCRAGPRFQSKLGLSKDAALSTALTNVKGLAIIDPQANGGQGGLYQHETWDDAGFLGPFITDRAGNIYVAPVPLVSLVENPPGEQNRVYRVDTDNRAMTLLADLRPKQPVTGGNPFGVVGLAYDCDTNSLYATSLAGSTAGQQAGRIYQIDTATGKVVSQMDGVDAMGVAVFNGASGKRLYFAPARASEIRSVALDAGGKFAGEPRVEFNYAQHTLAGRRIARRIRFTDAAEMKLNTREFNYSLQVASKRMEDVITYRYDQATDKWTFDKVDPAK